jgi:hypothetical protein
MDSPGIYNLGDAVVSAVVTNVVLTSTPDAQGVAQGYVDGLDGMLSAGFDINFNAGNGAGTSATVDIFTTLNQAGSASGGTWQHIARAKFSNMSDEKSFNVSGLTPRTTGYSPTTPADNTAVDGIVGPRWRALLTTVGVFGGNSSVSVRMIAR